MRTVGPVLAIGATLIAVSAVTAIAQQSAATAGADVTADEATPLPPIVVQSPAEPVARPRRRRALQAASEGASPSTGPAYIDAETQISASPATDETGQVGIFTLGQLDLIGGSTITNEAMWTYNKTSLDQAVNILPGVSMQNTGGSRNERDIFVRGFDRFRVPLSVDGVRVYLPADNRLDFNRFLTPDLAEIQVQKGYVSVLNGPGGLGGAINLVSRKPTKEIDVEARSGAVFTGDADDLNSWNGYAFAGTRQDLFYAQVSGTIVDQDHFNLSDDFDPVFVANEDGGLRDNSEFEDWRINAKVGITPNATDEYVLSYTTQHGEKSAPLHVEGQAVQGPRYWKWPEWDTSSLAFFSKTALDPASYLKTTAYYNEFYNVLSSFDDISYSKQTLTAPGFRSAFDSYYDDMAYGGSVELGTTHIPWNTLKAVAHYRRDVHQEFDQLQPDGRNIREPEQKNREDTLSFAAENTFHATPSFDIVTGVGYDILNVARADGLEGTSVLFSRDTPDADAWNYQAAGIYSFSPTGKVHASVSDRARFATIFERFSTRFGLAIPNPDLDPERSQNYEIGIAETLFDKARVSGAVFYNDLKDSIQPVFSAERQNATTTRVLVQNQNIDGENYGVEVSADWDIVPGVRVGGNYTYLERDYDYVTVGAKPEGTPRHEAFLYVAWEATDRLTITPSLELASDRSSLITSADSTLLSARPPVGFVGIPNYARTGSYALVNLQAQYEFTDGITGAIGGTNLLDEDYELAQGFPEAGRMFFANLRARY